MKKWFYGFNVVLTLIIAAAFLFSMPVITKTGVWPGRKPKRRKEDEEQEDEGGELE